MLNIKEKPSKNEVYVSGILKELEVDEGTTQDGRKYVRGQARIVVDQEVNGKNVEEEIPVRFFSMEKKSDGTANPNYARILGYREIFTSIAAAEDSSKASRVTISGRSANIEENLWYDQSSGSIRNGFQISSNFINAARPTDEEKAVFELSGVVGKMIEEVDSDGNETGRLKINFVVIGYNGKANVVDLIAADSAKDYIQSHWETGDTVNVAGKINMTYIVKTFLEEQGFGEPIKRTKVESKRELLIDSGSPSGLEESLSYDSDDVKAALAERTARMEAMKTSAKTTKAPAKTTSFNF